MTESQTYVNPVLNASWMGQGPSSAAGVHMLQAWTKTHAKLLDSTETLMKSWFDRNRAAAEANADAMQRLSACKDPAEIAKIWTDLASSSADRATQAANAYYEQCTKMWQEIAEAARAACEIEAPRASEPAPKEERAPVNVRRAAG